MSQNFLGGRGGVSYLAWKGTRQSTRNGFLGFEPEKKADNFFTVQKLT